jgi:hypothetical protein
MTSSGVFDRHRYVDARQLYLLFIVVIVGLSFAMISELSHSPVSCEHHEGAFSNDFSPDFDINRTDCRISGIENFSALQFWGVSPYVGIGL